MEGHCSTGQNPQWAVVPMEGEEEEEQQQQQQPTTWTLWEVDQKQLENFEMWCWRRMEKITWPDHVINEEVLLRVKEQRNILHEVRKWKANWIGHILCRNCLLQWLLKER